MFCKLSFVIFLLFTHNIVVQTYYLRKKFINNIHVKERVRTKSIFIPDPPDVTNHKNLDLLDHKSCGPVAEQKIFGGSKAGLSEFPWMALLGYDTEEENQKYFKFACGGTIINKRYVLTAAHCVSSLPSNVILTKVRVGEHNVNEERDCEKDMDDLELLCAEKYQDFGIEKIHLHFKYSDRSIQNDIALLRLNKEIDFRPANVKPICLPIGPAANMTQKMVTVTGWGATEKGLYNEDLLLIHLHLVPTEKCDKLYRNSANAIKISYKQICAGGEKGVDSCSADSGGPLQSPGIYNNDVKFIQYGIVSFGLKNCGTEGFPGVYTKVSYFMDWILDTIKD